MVETLIKVDDKVLAEIAEEKKIRHTQELFILFSLGSQFDHLIKQALDKLGVFCLVADPARIKASDVSFLGPKGIIISGGPASVYDEILPFDAGIFDLEIPVLGICLGFQLWASYIGCIVSKSEKREFGTHMLSIVKSSFLFQDCDVYMPLLESHGDKIEPNDKLKVLAKTVNAPVAAGRHKNLWGVQFHPEVTETKFGLKILENFVFKICKAEDRYSAEEVVDQKIAILKKRIGDKKVLLALSGGSDSATTAYLLRNALRGNKEQLRAIYIKGIDRPDDEAHVIQYFGNQDWLELQIVDAALRYLEVLKGKKTMLEKRMAVRKVYKFVLEEQIKDFGADFIAQGTLLSIVRF